jgi:hypothetical protein
MISPPFIVRKIIKNSMFNILISKFLFKCYLANRLKNPVETPERLIILTFFPAGRQGSSTFNPNNKRKFIKGQQGRQLGNYLKSSAISKNNQAIK